MDNSDLWWHICKTIVGKYPINFLGEYRGFLGFLEEIGYSDILRNSIYSTVVCSNRADVISEPLKKHQHLVATTSSFIVNGNLLESVNPQYLQNLRMMTIVIPYDNELFFASFQGLSALVPQLRYLNISFSDETVEIRTTRSAEIISEVCSLPNLRYLILNNFIMEKSSAVSQSIEKLHISLGGDSLELYTIGNQLDEIFRSFPKLKHLITEPLALKTIPEGLESYTFQKIKQPINGKVGIIVLRDYKFLKRMVTEVEGLRKLVLKITDPKQRVKITSLGKPLKLPRKIVIIGGIVTEEIFHQAGKFEIDKCTIDFLQVRSMANFDKQTYENIVNFLEMFPGARLKFPDVNGANNNGKEVIETWMVNCLREKFADRVLFI